jgi:hypothetical protein
MTQDSGSTLEQTVLALAERQQLLRARDLAEHALPTIVLSRLVAAGRLERVARGIYSLPGRAHSEHRSLAEVALRVPRGVVCLLSALRVHGMGTQAQFEVWVAIPHHSPTPRGTARRLPAAQAVNGCAVALRRSGPRGQCDAALSGKRHCMTANLAASVRARLKRRADAAKQDFNLTLTQYGLERLLYRLSVSPHAANYLLKGALLFSLWFDQPH